jgi:hypothetical protein
MPQTTLYLRVNGRTVELLNIANRLSNRRSDGITPLFFSIVERPRRAVIVQGITVAAEAFGEGSQQRVVHTPVRLHTWIVDPSNGRLIATHEQILGDRLTNQTYLFGTFQSAGLERSTPCRTGCFQKRSSILLRWRAGSRI